MEFRAVHRSVLPLSLALLAALSTVACDKASPVAPEGSILTVTANPSQVPLNGTSTITILGRKADGNPLNPGTEVRLSSDRGTVDPVVALRDGGVATATFRADTRSGPVTITAMTGGGESMATAMIQVGESDETKPTVTVTANPSNIQVGETSTITVIARNADNTPVGAGQRVTLTTTLGTLDNTQPRTDASGRATARLTAGTQGGTATVSAFVGSSDIAETMVEIRDTAAFIGLDANPDTITRAGGMIILTATVTNSQGQPVAGAQVRFSTSGTLGSSFSGGGLSFTNDNGTATNTLTLSDEDLEDVDEFEVIARTPSPVGTNGQLEARVEIDVTGGGT